MSIGDWALLASTEAQTAAAWVSIVLAGVACVLGFCRFVVHWPVPWFWIFMSVFAAVAAGALAFGLIPTVQPLPGGFD